MEIIFVEGLEDWMNVFSDQIYVPFSGCSFQLESVNLGIYDIVTYVIEADDFVNYIWIYEKLTKRLSDAYIWSITIWHLMEKGKS